MDLAVLIETGENLLRVRIAALYGARNPHVLRVHSGFCAPYALHSNRSLRFSPVSDCQHS